MRRVTIAFAGLFLILQSQAATAPRGVTGWVSEASGMALRGRAAGISALTPRHAGSTSALLAHPAAGPRAPTHVPLPTVSISSVFAPRPPSFPKLDKHRMITLIATGDVIPARSVNYEMFIRNDYTYPFLKTYRFTRAADLTLINLESPLINGCTVTNSGMSFCGDPRVVAGLKLAGVDVANLPNNHIGNYGVAGIQETEQHLTDAKIAWDGFGNTVYKKVKGVTFAFLGFNGVGQLVDTAEMSKEIHAARKRADVVVVSFHWGREYTSIPLTAPGIADQDPRMIAHLAVKAGADVVVGNHPHWVQGIELYQGKFIAYANGNFVFDQMWSIETRQGVVATYTFYGKRLISVRFQPVQIDNYAQPYFLSAVDGAPILARMREASLQIQKGY